jgi:hypothetical protein
MTGRAEARTRPKHNKSLAGRRAGQKAHKEKKEVKPGVWEWHETKNNADNHGLDTSAMQLVIASVRGIISTQETNA